MLTSTNGDAQENRILRQNPASMYGISPSNSCFLSDDEDDSGFSDPYNKGSSLALLPFLEPFLCPLILFIITYM